MVSGPIATMILADQGADVIKIESPAGDHMRRVGTKHKGMTSSFLTCNRGKRSMCVDVKQSKGLALVLELVKSADVLVQNFRPGVIERMGLGEDRVRELKPDIIYLSISGFGKNGPHAHQRVYDPVIQALSGLADVQRDQKTGVPRMVRTIICDKTTALTAAHAITTALFYREKTGEGQTMDLAMLDTMVGFLWPETMGSLSFVGKEQDPAHSQKSPDLVFKTADGYITAGANSDSEWEGMCNALNRPDLICDPRFKTAQARSENIAQRRQIVSDEISSWVSEKILERFDLGGVASAPILTRIELINNPQIVENNILTIIKDEILGDVRVPRPPVQHSGQPTCVRKLAPFQGADNRALMLELGYKEPEINQYVRDEILHQPSPDD
ncbi:MAG TPA: CoA transferase [Gammaproteobacteria bacterium]|nr:CoA transferase [Gammaproteobacteria bacterium]HIB07241.1 CoA transferase [Gammaproteobacteria bacterium]HIC21291.1 CoA transferase [Gammaproteobacteria bacterium]HIO35413.1 CoA transferase [Gammaproteobacteria bacterium]HIP04035.1 CoA transferase [Gammaproteobacteria bacterium]